MPASNGYRARTRYMFQHDFRKGGVINLTNYLTNYKVGDYVDIKANPTVHKGMPFKFYHGRTGIVFNVTKRALGLRVNKEVNGRIIKKRINVRVEHVTPSKCRQEVLRRTKENEAKKVDARKTGVQVNLKRSPVQPKAGYTVVLLEEPTTMRPTPFVDLV